MASANVLCDRRGATAIEHVVVLAMVGLAALGAWRWLGTEIYDRADCVAQAIAGAPSPCDGGAAGARAEALSRTGAIPAALTEDSGVAAAREDVPAHADAGALAARRTGALESARSPAPSWASDSDRHAPARIRDAARGAGAFALGVGKGAVRSVWDTVKLVAQVNWGYNPFINPVEASSNWAELVTHPSTIWDFASGIPSAIWMGLKEDWHTLRHGSWQERGVVVGQFVPDVVLAIVTGGAGGASLRAARTTARAVEDAAPARGTARLGAIGDAFEPPRDLADDVSATASRIDRNDFQVMRGMREYYDHFTFSFRDVLNELGPDDSWIDMGAGAMVAPRNFAASRFGYHPSRRPPHMSGVVYEWPGLDPDEIPRIEKSLRGRIFHGRFVEDYSAAELGRHDLVTDLYGPFSYSTRPDEVMRRYAEVTETGGHIFLRFEDGRLRINTSTGPSTPLAWLESIDGLEVVETTFRRWGPGDGPNNIGPGERTLRMVHLRKVKDDVSVPSLTLRDVRDDGPPYRRFDWETTAPREPIFAWTDVNVGGSRFGRRDINCVRCAIAVDQTLEGANTMALPIRSWLRDGPTMTSEHLARALGRDPDDWIVVDATYGHAYGAERAVEEWGPGGKGIVEVTYVEGWRDRLSRLVRTFGRSLGRTLAEASDSEIDDVLRSIDDPEVRAHAEMSLQGPPGHVFNVLNEDGTVLFIDGQSAARGGEIWPAVKRLGIDRVRLLRTDDIADMDRLQLPLPR